MLEFLHRRFLLKPLGQTGRALYIIVSVCINFVSVYLHVQSFDYTLEKVKLYTRVPLGDITGITKGQTISPTMQASNTL